MPPAEPFSSADEIGIPHPLVTLDVLHRPLHEHRPLSHDHDFEHSSETTAISCSTMSIDRFPPETSSRRYSAICSPSVGFTPAMGSSSSRNRASLMSEREISTRRFWPPLSSPAYWSSCSASPQRESSSRAFSTCCASHRRAARAPKSAPRNESALPGGAPWRRFSSTVRCSKTLEIWNVRAIPRRATWYVDNPASSCPSHLMEPRDRCTAAAIAFSTVVFPAPFGPMRPVIWPPLHVNVTPSTARTPPKLQTRSSTTSTSFIREPPWIWRRAKTRQVLPARRRTLIGSSAARHSRWPLSFAKESAVAAPGRSPADAST